MSTVVKEKYLMNWYVGVKTTSTSGYITDHFVSFYTPMYVYVFINSATGSPGTITINLAVDRINDPNSGWNPTPVQSWSVSSAPASYMFTAYPEEYPYIVTYSCPSCSSTAYYTVSINIMKP